MKIINAPVRAKGNLAYCLIPGMPPEFDSCTRKLLIHIGVTCKCATTRALIVYRGSVF